MSERYYSRYLGARHFHQLTVPLHGLITYKVVGYFPSLVRWHGTRPETFTRPFAHLLGRLLKTYFFTARSSYVSAVLGIVILSVCVSVRHASALWRNERTYSWNFERVITLVLSHQRRLVGDIPFHLRPISAYNVSTVRASEKCLTSRIRSRPRAFQLAIDEVPTLPLTPPKSGSKSEFVVFVNKIRV